MFKLLTSNFSRMWKNKFLYAGFLVLIGLITLQLYKSYSYKQGHSDYIMSLDSLLFMYSKVAVIISSIFTGFFIGTEYSDKTIRNKIIVGHTRITIYIANMITCALAAILLFLAPIAVTLLAGIPLGGTFTLSSHILIKTLLCSILTIIVFVSVFMLIVMLIPNKAIGTITVLITTALMMISAVIISEMLNEPKMIQGVANIDSAGNIIEFSEEPNPNYLDGKVRTIFQMTYDCLPGCQMEQYSQDIVPQNISLFPMYSLLLILVFSGAGILIFRKINLK